MISLKKDENNSLMNFYVYDIFRWTSSGDFIECSADYVKMTGGPGTTMVINPTTTDVLTGEINPLI